MPTGRLFFFAKYAATPPGCSGQFFPWPNATTAALPLPAATRRTPRRAHGFPVLCLPLPHRPCFVNLCDTQMVEDAVDVRGYYGKLRFVGVKKPPTFQRVSFSSRIRKSSLEMVLRALRFGRTAFSSSKRGEILDQFRSHDRLLDTTAASVPDLAFFCLKLADPPVPCVQPFFSTTVDIYIPLGMSSPAFFFGTHDAFAHVSENEFGASMCLVYLSVSVPPSDQRGPSWTTSSGPTATSPGSG